MAGLHQDGDEVGMGSGQVGRKTVFPEQDKGLFLFSFFLNFLAMLCGMRDLSSLTKDQTCAPCSRSAKS